MKMIAACVMLSGAVAFGQIEVYPVQYDINTLLISLPSGDTAAAWIASNGLGGASSPYDDSWTNDLSAVAYSGDYSDLTGAPSIPSAYNDSWTNNLGDLAWLDTPPRTYGIWGIDGGSTIGVLHHRIFRTAGWWGLNAAAELIVTNTGWTDEFWTTNTLGELVTRAIP